jgi:hypothetical protein
MREVVHLLKQNQPIKLEDLPNIGKSIAADLSSPLLT